MVFVTVYSKIFVDFRKQIMDGWTNGQTVGQTSMQSGQRIYHGPKLTLSWVTATGPTLHSINPTKILQ